MSAKRTKSLLAAGAVAALAVTALTVTTANAAAGCRVSYAVTSQWQSGFGASVAVTNLGDPISSWNLVWSFGAGQSITQIWNATHTQSGAQVTARNVSYNGSIATNATVSFGFNGAWAGSNPVPTAFTLNGTACTGGVTPTSAPPTSAAPTTPPPTTPPPTSPPPTGTLPSTLRWSSSGVLAGPKPDAAHSDIAAIKDYTVVRHNNAWQVYATTASPARGWNLVHFSFPDWPQANAATHTYLDTATPIGTGYRAAPHIFYFAPQNLWYMVYQTPLPTYSTSTDPSNPRSWTTPRNFIGSEPAIVTQNKGSGSWLDFWMICDSANCYLFSSDDNGHIYRSQTTMASFPNGFGNTVIALQDSNRFNLFEGSAVYKVGSGNQYLLLQEAIGSDGKRWYRSFTSSSLAGSWTPHLATEANPFARSNNVTFSGTAWTRDFSHGELIRAGNDQTVPLNPCQMRFLYQGMDPNASGDYIRLPWRMGLLTQTNSTC
ncbi:non-reducing end alpha-L-arabinofuranosidase family hydrolase [Phytohabitans rumicis]|uniref:non-reducing end alpha-L-arabinofuranosidase n=1 Tax=Phytohabitans rumicis TaxID=1076125 RepID=A0A6V8LJ09_9ACTN|nr:non-reducing end alpha-L-arabinofuranosidase family hydrolase [Phytohabitans rumicis]GFJ94047.1 hypothetical protein Prum_076890 [Phytohabitans rumicis]